MTFVAFEQAPRKGPEGTVHGCRAYAELHEAFRGLALGLLAVLKLLEKIAPTTDCFRTCSLTLPWLTLQDGTWVDNLQHDDEAFPCLPCFTSSGASSLSASTRLGPEESNDKSKTQGHSEFQRKPGRSARRLHLDCLPWTGRAAPQDWCRWERKSAISEAGCGFLLKRGGARLLQAVTLKNETSRKQQARAWS